MKKAIKIVVMIVMFTSAICFITDVKALGITELATFTGHNETVVTAIFSSDDKYVLTGSGDRTLKLWDIHSGKIVHTLTGHSAPISDVSICPSGKYAASASLDNTVRIWDLTTGNQISTYSGHGASVLTVTFSQDGTHVFSGCRYNNLMMWSIKTVSTTQRYVGHTSSILTIVTDSSGSLIASGSHDNTLKIWDVTTGKELQSFRHPDAVTSVAFTTCSNYVLSGCDDGIIRLWDLNSGQEVTVFRGHAKSVSSVAICPNDFYALSGGLDKTVRVWDLYSGQQLVSIEAHEPTVNSVAFSHDGSKILTSGSDKKIKTWSFVTWVPTDARAHYDDYRELLNAIFHIERRFDDIVKERVHEKMQGPRGEFETLNAYQERLRESKTRSDYYYNMEVELIKNELVDMHNKSNTVFNELSNVLNKPIEMDIKIGKYDPDRQELSIHLVETLEVVPLFIDIAQAQKLVPQIRNHSKKGMVVFYPNQRIGISVKELTIKEPTGGSDLVYKFDDEDKASKPVPISLPPDLIVSDPVFSDTDGDNRLSAGERALVRFSLQNKGLGVAQGVRITGTADAAIDGLNSIVGDIQPNETRSISLTITGRQEIKDGRASITLSFSEANGFHPDPVRLVIPTKAFRPPELVVFDVGVEDSQGRGIITPGQVIEVTTRLHNQGQGVAEDIVVTIAPGSNVFLAGNYGSSRNFNLGTLEPGGYRDVTFQAFANREATGFPVNIAATEKSARYGLPMQDLGLQIDRQQRTIRQLTVDGRTIEKSFDQVPGLSISIEKDIPQAATINTDAVAVIVGNRSYRGDTPDVAFALRDASLVRRYTELALGYRPGNILYLEDATLTEMRVVFGDERSPRGRLSDLVKRGDSDVFVYYSGHGAPETNTNKGYLMPVDADANRLALSGYSLDVLYENLRKLESRSVTVIIDACFSGATGAGDMLIAQASPIGIQIDNPAAGLPNGTVITASSGSQIASWHPEKRHGLLTYFFLKGLQGAADSDNDGSITVSEMQRYLTDRNNGLPYYARRLHSRDQMPQVWGNPDRILR